MSAPRWSDVLTGTLTLLPTLAGASDFEFFDSQAVTNDVPPNYVEVGFVTDDGAGAFQQDRDPSGFGTVEVGEVRCRLVANAGDIDPSITRTTAFAFVGAWQSALEEDQTLSGFLPAGSVINLSTQVMSVQNGQGSATSLLVTISYQTLTFFNP